VPSPASRPGPSGFRGWKQFRDLPRRRSVRRAPVARPIPTSDVASTRGRAARRRFCKPISRRTAVHCHRRPLANPALLADLRRVPPCCCPGPDTAAAVAGHEGATAVDRGRFCRRHKGRYPVGRRKKSKGDPRIGKKPPERSECKSSHNSQRDTRFIGIPVGVRGMDVSRLKPFLEGSFKARERRRFIFETRTGATGGKDRRASSEMGAPQPWMHGPGGNRITRRCDGI